MRNAKKCLWTVCLLLVALICVVSFAACSEEEHEHEYTTSTVASTCTQKGATSYTCSCGDSYTEELELAAHTMEQNIVIKAATCDQNGLASPSKCSVCGYSDGTNVVIKALGHKYKTSYIYPTVTMAGSRMRTCQVCRHAETDKISALTAKMPKVSKGLASALGTTSCCVELDENSTFILTRELSDYANKNGSKTFVNFRLAEFAVDSDGEVFAARLKFDLDLYDQLLDGSVPAGAVMPNEQDKTTYSIYVYVNNEDVSVEIDGDDVMTDEALTSLVYELIGEMMGVNYEEMAQMTYVMGELVTYAPLLEEIAELTVEKVPAISPDVGEAIVDVLELVGEEFFIVNDDGGGNTVYAADLTALKQLADSLEDKSISDYVKDVFGEDVVTDVITFLKALPDKTVKSVANQAVAIAENAEVSVDDLYMLIDLYVYYATGEGISFGEMVFSRYNDTVADVIAEVAGVSDAEKEEAVAEIRHALTQAANTLTTTSLADLLDVNLNELVVQFKEAIDELDDAATLIFIVDAQDMLVSMEVGFFDEGYAFDYECKNDELVVTVMAGDHSATLQLAEQESLFVVYENDFELFRGEINVTDLSTALMNIEFFEGDMGFEVFLNMADGLVAEVLGYSNSELLLDADVVFNGEGISVSAETGVWNADLYVSPDFVAFVFVDGHEEVFSFHATAVESAEGVTVSTNVSWFDETLFETEFLCGDSKLLAAEFEGFGYLVIYEDGNREGRRVIIDRDEVHVTIVQNVDESAIQITVWEVGVMALQMTFEETEDGAKALITSGNDGEIVILDGSVTLTRVSSNEIAIHFDVPCYVVQEIDFILSGSATYTETTSLGCDATLRITF